MYDPATARFLSKDPLEERGGSPNLYLYCANDPVNKTDPSGRQEKPSSLPRWFEENAGMRDGKRGISDETFRKIFGVISNPHQQSVVDTAFDEIAGKKMATYLTEDVLVAALKGDGGGTQIARYVSELYDGTTNKRTRYELLRDGLVRLKNGEELPSLSRSPGGGGGTAIEAPTTGSGSGSSAGRLAASADPNAERKMQILNQNWEYSIIQLRVISDKTETIGYGDTRRLYDMDEEYKKLVDELDALNRKTKIQLPVRPGDKPSLGAWWLSRRLTDEEEDAVRRVENVLPDDELRALRDAARAQETKINRRAHEVRVPRINRFAEGATWAAIKTGAGIGELIANPGKVADGLHTLATNAEARQHVLDEIEKKLKDDTAEGRGEVAFEVVTLLSGVGTGAKVVSKIGTTTVKVTLKVSKPVAQKLKNIIKSGGKLTSKELDEVIEANATAAGNPLRTTGATSGTPVPNGQGLGKLAGKELKVTQGNLAEVEAHLMEFAKRHNEGVHFPENEMMLKRLRDAVRDDKPISGADLAFYTHELHELKNMARLMKDGAKTFDEAYDIAHPGALNAFGNSPFSVYHPDVIKALNAQSPGYFNNNWLKFWGIE